MHLSDFDLRFDRYRLIQPKADLLMARSIAKYSQLAPVVYCQLEGSLVLVDGFIRRRENAAFVGESGLGKTHLIQGVARKCCALGYRVIDRTNPIKFEGESIRGDALRKLKKTTGQ